MKLPILIESPDSLSINWLSVQAVLLKISEHEKELANRDRIADKVLPLAQNYAKRKEWAALFRFLCEREIVATENTVAEPLPKPKRRKPSPSNPKPKSGRVPLKHRIRAALPQVLYADRAIGIPTIKARLAAVGVISCDRLCRDYLKQFSDEGIIYKSAASISKFALYALNPTTTIDKDEWLPVSLVFGVARSKGYKHSFGFFKNRANTCTSDEGLIAFYEQYGIEYKLEAEPMDNYRWRLLQCF